MNNGKKNKKTNARSFAGAQDDNGKNAQDDNFKRGQGNMVDSVNTIRTVGLDRLVEHPDNPNRMSEAVFGKLVRNIQQTSRYEPLIVRPAKDKEGYYQIINGHHRYKALTKLGYKEADVVIWDVDDEQTDILLSTLNRLSGRDVLEKKLELLRRLKQKYAAKQLAALLPQTARQIEKLADFKIPSAPKINEKAFAKPLVFFVDDRQAEIVERALVIVDARSFAGAQDDNFHKGTKAQRRAEALVMMAERTISSYLVNRESSRCIGTRYERRDTKGE